MSETARDVPLAPLTTLRIGGPATLLTTARDEAELVEATRGADEADEPLLVLAGGSNVVVPDSGWPGPALLVRSRGVERRRLADGRVELLVQAGEEWDRVVAEAVEEGLAGIECLAGIPGSTGATPIQNVGAYGQEVSSVITRVRVLDRTSGEVVELGPGGCGFGYRASRFKRNDRYLVLAAGFALRPAGESEPLAYAQLAAALELAVGERAPLGDVRAAVLELRRAKGMVVDPGDPDSVSAGSFFTNPVLEADAFAELERRVEARLGAEIKPPSWPQPDGTVKVSAAWLIERAGFGRGYGDGRAGISTRHSLALVNRGGASAAELIALARELAAGVDEAFGVRLRPEPVLIGEDW